MTNLIHLIDLFFLKNYCLPDKAISPVTLLKFHFIQILEHCAT